MSEFPVSAALLRTLPRLMARVRSGSSEALHATRPATQPHLKQAAHCASDRVVAEAIRRRPTTEEREKEIGRRRTWAGGGNMPPDVRSRYSEAERAALSVIAEQCKRKGFCDLSLDEIARLAGVGRTSIQNAIRKARSKERAHISVRERPQRGSKSLTNIIKIICSSWLGWIARAIGFKRLNTSETAVKYSLSKSPKEAKQAFEKEGADRPETQSHRLFSGFSPGFSPGRRIGDDATA
ncbi:hypothetical protein ELH42_16920 [Rhizobium ruizarguesonis]|nr:hypothetical protein ELH42_16920 [Rhizobium ruizarguesonis]